MNLIEQLYYGELNPFEHPPLNEDEYYRLAAQTADNETALLNGMTEEQKEKYKKYYDSASRHHLTETRPSPSTPA